MKKLLSFFAAMLTFVFCNAQITDGMFAADFHLYEIDTTTHAVDTSHTINLYSMLNDYKTVYIDISAATCVPCHDFHIGGTFSTLINNYGPGTAADDSRALLIEGKKGTTWEALTGQLGGNYWDMTENTNYPLIPLRMEPNYPNLYNSFRSDYPYEYYPTLFMVCPNRTIYTLWRNGPQDNVAEEWHDYALDVCPCVTHSNAAYLVPNTCKFAPAYFCDYEISPTIKIQNTGRDTLTSATIITSFNNSIDTFVWQGNLPQFGFADIDFPTLSGSGDGDLPFTFTISSVNGVANEDTIHNTDTYIVRVLSEGHISTIEEDFSELTTGIPAGWTALEDPDNCYFVTYTGYNNDTLAFFYFGGCYLDTGKKYQMAMPVFDFSNTENPMLQFDIAYWQIDASTNDRFEVFYSLDCGDTWISAYDKAGAELSKSGIFRPLGWWPDSAGDFRTDRVLLSQAAFQHDVIIKFVFTSGHGSLLCFDNIKVYDGNPTSIDILKNSELSIYPIPTADVLYINYDKAIKQVEVYDINGRCVSKYGNIQRSINVSNLSSGTYILNFITEEGLIIKKFVKE